ncbi:hypothetical protein D9M71_458550 [compost metagenome]
MIGRLEHLALAGGRHHQVILRVYRPAGQRFELHGQGRIVGGQTSGIDQHHALARQRGDGLGQGLARIDQGHRHIEDATEGLDLLLGANAETVHAHQGDVLRAVLEHVAGSQLGQGGGLAHAGRADQGDHAALFQRLDLRGADGVGEVRQEHAPGLARITDLVHLVQQRAGQFGRQPHALQAAPEAGLLRTAALHLAPGDGAQLHFDQFTQATQFEAHGVQGGLVHAGGFRRAHRLHRTRNAAGTIQSGGQCGFRQFRFDGGQWLAGEQLTVLAGIGDGPGGQFGLGFGDARLGLAQFGFEGRVRPARGRRGQRVVQRRGQLDTAGNPTITDDGGIRAQFITHQLHGLTHIGGEETFDLHGP